MALVLAVAVGGALSGAPARPATAPAARTPVALGGNGRTYERVKPSVVTVEVHSGNADAKSALGSGYVIASDGRVITNYHVVGSYVDEPGRYRIRVRASDGTAHDARLLRFDLVADLALLHVEALRGKPALPLSEREPSPGEPIVAFGNPEGLGMSLIEGVFNGRARKGVVDRLLLSMPLNAGMSGGPILDSAGAVVGTNVSVIWLSNSLSFGVPVAGVRALLAQPALGDDKATLHAETTRQLAAVEASTVERALAPLLATPGTGTVRVGDVRGPRPPDVFECWDDTQVRKDKDYRWWDYTCNLQFTPSIEGLGEVASIQLLVRRTQWSGSSFGLYATARQFLSSTHEPRQAKPDNGVLSAPECVADRVRAGAYAWHVATCLNAFVAHPGFYRVDVAAVTLSEPRRLTGVALHLSGFRLEPALALVRATLEGARPAEAP
jgi:S1-C subfamily serine protease